MHEEGNGPATARLARVTRAERIARPLKLVLAALVIASLLGCSKVRDAYLDHKLRDRSDPTFVSDKETLRVLLCGTGTPQGGTGRAQACTLVAAGGMLFLFDAGEGATANLTRYGVPLNDLNRVFVTHWHSDHFNGLATLINHGWVWGRRASRRPPMGAHGDAAGSTQPACRPDFRFCNRSSALRNL